ncbi:hypothetical protein B0H13DRAFT_1856104 [Mycena leptocephala]|nr:hypothetical protein B0H13DRAFT_1856104 [Mycena leptocephala]
MLRTCPSDLISCVGYLASNTDLSVKYSRSRASGGSGAKKYIAASEVRPWILDTATFVSPTDLSTFDCHMAVKDLTTGNVFKIRANFPLRLLVAGLNGPNLRKIGTVYSVPNHKIFNLIGDPNPERLQKQKLVQRAWREGQRAKKCTKPKRVLLDCKREDSTGLNSPECSTCACKKTVRMFGTGPGNWYLQKQKSGIHPQYWRAYSSDQRP